MTDPVIRIVKMERKPYTPEPKVHAADLGAAWTMCGFVESTARRLLPNATIGNVTCRNCRRELRRRGHLT